MKNLITFLFTLFISIGAFAQCSSSGLVFSSYLEGSSNNKCIEIYNGTGMAVDLGDYSIDIYSNGSATVSSSIDLGISSLPDGETFLVCNTACALPYCSGADIMTGNVSFNGNDALQLINTATMEPNDCFGVIGEDPGSFWGTGACVTANATLIRDLSVATCSGTCLSSFDPAAWATGGCLPADEVLPVKLTSFTAKLVNSGNVELNWATESEVNTDKYIVQHSYEGNAFEEIAEERALGAGDYYAEHYKPKAGTHYYRLKVIDFDGTYAFSEVRSVKVTAQSFGISPNPVSSLLTVSFNQEIADVDVQIIDVAGRIIRSYNSGSEQTQYTIDVSALPVGQYFLRTIAREDIQTERFVKIEF